MALMTRPTFPVPRYANGIHEVPPKVKSKTGNWYMTHVKDGDNWVSLAMLDKWSFPWELIEANFRTQNAEEVNWYLKHYMGCKAETVNKNNFRFSSTDNPGIIWTQNIIRRKGEPDPIKLYRFVKATLSSPHINKLNFTMFNGHRITSRMFHQVRSFVDRGWIQVIYDPSLTHCDGMYQIETNRLRFNSAAESSFNAALIVHECTHAGVDHIATTFGSRNINKACSEAVAYVSQCLFFHHYTGRYLSAQPTSIYDAANEIVVDLVDRQMRGGYAEAYAVKKTMADNLVKAINGSSLYKGASSKTVKYDGIKDPRWH